MGSIADFCCQQKTQRQNRLQKIPKLRQFKDKGVLSSLKQPSGTKSKQKITSKPSLKFSDEYSPTKQSELMIEEIIHEKQAERDDKKVVFDDFEIRGKLGSGNYGAVFKVNYLKEVKSGKSTDYAMKRIAISRLNNKRSEQNVRLERFILSQMQNPFITQLKFAFKDQNYIYLVMECGNGGSLDSFLNIKKTTNPKKNMRAVKFKNLGEFGIKFVAANIILGIQHLHNHNIMYRDLKPQNIIVFDDGFVKLTDFGLSKIVKDEDTANTEAGTIVYFAPEMVQRKNYTKMIDFWAIGVFLYELLTSQTPFKETQILLRKKFREIVKQHETNRDWKNQSVSGQLKDLINRLLVFQPDERLGFKGFVEIKAHPFFKQIDWQELSEKKIQSPLKKIIEQHPNRVIQANPYHFKSINSLKSTSKQDQEWNFIHTDSMPFIKEQRQQ